MTCGHFQALLRDVDWKNLSKNTGIAVLSVFAFGLFVKNRKLAFELKRKHEVCSGDSSKTAHQNMTPIQL